ncbi:glycosyltransferase [Geodermatophilus sabuli]|uniref:Glycosyltransferase n=1 Tax=Geodermatophilus sabuli TaxID=1564158 RepID=A0A7K3W4B0_9ACTN|nr:glycosyltransferase [Geodermatophilus sabuli]NEK58687.1 glycosyltransferase [Geodermatophilus sabuli]
MTAGATATYLRSLLCVSPLAPPGGVDTLLTAFGLLAEDRPELRLEVVGGGPLSRALRRHADDLGLTDRVDFCGPLPPPAVRTAVHRCTMLVLPHREDRWAGACSPLLPLRVALESARPVVATPVAALPEVVRHGETGLLVPPDDPTALALAVTELLDDPEWATALGRAGRRAAVCLPDDDGDDAEPGRVQRLWRHLIG